MNKKEIFEHQAFVKQQNGETSAIGTLSEKTLHSYLKRYFEPNIDNQEIKIGRYFADIVNENGIIEIQTQGFNKLRNKLEYFLSYNSVTIVYPIAQTKWLCWIDNETGEITKHRKSPKIGKSTDCFFELYKIKMFLNNPNLRLKLIFLELTEYRYLNGWSKDKKKGSTRCERLPSSVLSEVSINSKKDYIKLIPQGLPNLFTTKDFAKYAKINLSNAQTALNVLNFVGAVCRKGKTGRLYNYVINEEL